MKMVYPAIFYPEKEGGYSVVVPDLLGCNAQGETLQEAIQMAQDAALGWLLVAVEEKIEFPKMSELQTIKIEEGKGFVSLLLLDLETYLKKYGRKEVVEKIVTIPTWLNEKAEKKQINLSKALQEVLLYKVTHEK